LPFDRWGRIVIFGQKLPTIVADAVEQISDYVDSVNRVDADERRKLCRPSRAFSVGGGTWLSPTAA
jgi:hypothetical protein